MKNKDFMGQLLRRYNAFIFRCVRITEECGYGIVENMPGMAVRCSKRSGKQKGRLKTYCGIPYEKKVYRILEEGHRYLCTIDSVEDEYITASPLCEAYSGEKAVIRAREISVLESTVEDIYLAAGGREMEKEKLAIMQRAFGIKYVAGVYDIKVKTSYGNWMYDLLTHELKHENYNGSLRDVGNKGCYEQGWHLQETKEDLTDFYKALSYIVNHDFRFRRSKSEHRQWSLYIA